MKLFAFFLSIIYLSLAAACFVETNHENDLIGTWEYRMAFGESFDNEGEILKVDLNKGLLRGVYFGLEREGEHGLFYSAVEMKDLTVRSDGEVSFTVPERDLLEKRPESIQQTEQEKSHTTGFTLYELKMKGYLQGYSLTLYCTSKIPSCPEDVMVFHKDKWRAK